MKNDEDRQLMGVDFNDVDCDDEDDNGRGVTAAELFTPTGESDQNVSPFWKRWSQRMSQLQRRVAKTANMRDNSVRRPDSLAYNFVLTEEDDDDPSKAKGVLSQRARVQAKMEDAWWR